MRKAAAFRQSNDVHFLRAVSGERRLHTVPHALYNPKMSMHKQCGIRSTVTVRKKTWDLRLLARQ
jgi:hypothetical protein